MRSRLPALAALAATGALVVAATAAPASTAAPRTAAGTAAATAPAAVPAGPSALLTGRLRVIADAELREVTPADLAGDHADHADALHAYVEVGALGSAGATAVPVDAAAVAAVPPGAALTVRVAVPAGVAAQVRRGAAVRVRPVRTGTGTGAAATTATVPRAALDAAAAVPASSSSALSSATAVAAAAAGAPLAAAVVTTSATTASGPLAATAPATRQDLVVAVVGVSGGAWDATYDDAEVDRLVAGASDYWSQQTGGAVGFARSGAVTRYSSGLSCSDPNALWSEAAQRTGFVQGAGEHLVVLLPRSAYSSGGCSYGLGSVGAGPGAGGVVYVSDHSWPALAHELGHNMSLLHANRLQCGRAVDQAVGTSASYSSCAVQEYGDRTDVMSSASATADGTPVQATGSASAFELARLGLLAPSGRTTAPNGVSTFTVQPLSALSGLRSVLVTDPRTGDAYDLEVRANAGRDTYGWSASTRTTWGLRVLKAGADGGSLLLDPTPTTGTDSDVVVAPGTTFASAGGGVQVRTAAGAGGAQVVQVSVAAAGAAHWSTGTGGTGAATGPAVSAPATTATAGRRSSLAVTVAPASGAVAPRGWVSAWEGSRRLGLAAVSGGSATVGLPALAAGTHTVVLRFTPAGGGAGATGTTTVTAG